MKHTHTQYSSISAVLSTMNELAMNDNFQIQHVGWTEYTAGKQDATRR